MFASLPHIYPLGDLQSNSEMAPADLYPVALTSLNQELKQNNMGIKKRIIREK